MITKLDKITENGGDWIADYIKIYESMSKKYIRILLKKSTARKRYSTDNGKDNTKELRILQKWHRKQNEMRDTLDQYHQALFQNGVITVTVDEFERMYLTNK